MDHGEHDTNGRGRARRALIAGAGIAGLATATRLGRIGWETLIVERAPGRRSSGYLVNLVGPGYDAAEQLGILPELEARDLGTFTSILVRQMGGTSSPSPSRSYRPRWAAGPSPCSGEISSPPCTERCATTSRSASPPPSLASRTVPTGFR
ncbi:hypothetical protein ACQPZA_28920 [Pseudonocardia xinjiangensis]|uniref:hypothetical protein n=1 Tax=Pseudonocardia xinjiangensis TaxID=75289 RepID=UPI003D8CEF5B